MEIFHLAGRGVERLDPNNFTGEGTLVRMLGICEEPPINAYTVTFQAGTRTAWHTHTGPQILVVTDGTCRVQKDGDTVLEVETGGIVRIDPGQLHWHGATADRACTHVALNIDATTDWMEKVTDGEFAAD